MIGNMILGCITFHMIFKSGKPRTCGKMPQQCASADCYGFANTGGLNNWNCLDELTFTDYI